ncbi:MAG: hypothetical protein IJ777_03745 [Clostridia bacterium]|nr:hypothetical protein [Clostridia bacterium]
MRTNHAVCPLYLWHPTLTTSAPYFKVNIRLNEVSTVDQILRKQMNAKYNLDRNLYEFPDRNHFALALERITNFIE